MKKLEKIVETLRTKGFERQAVLLESSSKYTYLNVLLFDRWLDRVDSQFGTQTLSDIITFFEQKSRIGFRRAGRFYELPLDDRDFETHDYSVEPLSIKDIKTVGLDDVKRVSSAIVKLYELRAKVGTIIYDQVESVTASNANLLFEAYKDHTHVLDPNDPILIRKMMEREIKRMKDYLTTQSEFDSAVPFLRLKAKYLIESFELNSTLPKKEYEKLFLREAEQLLSNYQKFDENLRSLRSKFKDNVIEWAKESMSFQLDDYQTSKSGLLWYDLDNLIKQDLTTRSEFVRNYETEVEILKSTLTGLEQILAGGPVTNPSVSAISVLQNDDYFPNIHYSKQTKRKLEEIAINYRALFNNLMNISDIAVSSKLRRKDSLIYEIKELPKDPLDVTFGNDSGCCIFVPKSREELRNGYSVPYYLNDPHIRLFAIYRQDRDDKAQRMGLVLAFETYNEEQPQSKILSCNSLELSKLGIIGGTDVINTLVEYAEEWLVGYAQQNEYIGVTIGSHKYNTSANYSKRKLDTVKQPLIFLGDFVPFYSDIFSYDFKRAILQTRENSCYWLWKKE